MRRCGWRGLTNAGWMVAIALAATTAPARASDPFLLSVSVLGGAGGPLTPTSPIPRGPALDGAADRYGHRAPHPEVQLRVGGIDFGSAENRLGDTLSPAAEFATVGGEYRHLPRLVRLRVLRRPRGLSAQRRDSATGASDSEGPSSASPPASPPSSSLTTAPGDPDPDQRPLREPRSGAGCFATAMGGLWSRF